MGSRPPDERRGVGPQAVPALALAAVMCAATPGRGDPAGGDGPAADTVGGGTGRDGAVDPGLPPLRLEPPRYSGAYRGLTVGAGVASLDGAQGVVASASTRLSTVLHLADFELGYHLLHVPAADATVHRLPLSAQVHPLFPFLLLDGALNTILASLYVRVGIGPSLARASGAESELGAMWDWGVGVDVPVGGLEAGASFWLGALYLHSAALDDGPLADETIRQLQIRAGYRLHGF